MERRDLLACVPIAPGIWVDAEGAIHFSVPELLASLGWPDTPERRLMVKAIIDEVIALKAIIDEVIAQHYPSTPIHHQE